MFHFLELFSAKVRKIAQINEFNEKKLEKENHYMKYFVSLQTN